MNIEILMRYEISFKKQLEIVFLKKMAKAIEKLRPLLAAQGVQISHVLKVLQLRNCKNLVRVTLMQSNMVTSLTKTYLCRWDNALETNTTQSFSSMTMQVHI